MLTLDIGFKRILQSMTESIKIVKKYDISVILNCHNESIYVVSTLKSLATTIQKAVEKGATAELVIVLDKPSKELKNSIEMFKFHDYFCVKKIEVSNGSLGLSRNDGISVAEGEYIYLCDADDLVSANSIVDSLCAANDYFKTNKKHGCFVPQYVYTFGNRKNLTKLYDSRYFSPRDFVAYHPFCSRIFLHHSLFENRQFKNLTKETGFAFEDWEFNSELLVDEIEILPVKDTILFYRQRGGSIMSTGGFIKLPRLKHLGDASIFYRLNQKFKRPSDVQEKLLEDPLRLFKNSPKLLSYLKDAAVIDPTLDIDVERKSFDAIGKNLDCIGPHWGNLFNLLLNLIGYSKYDDIYLLPWLNAGGGEKYILQILSSILLTSHEKKALVITVENTDFNKWIHKLPENCIFLNFEKFTRDTPDSERKLLLCRLLLSISFENGTNLHVKTGVFANSFLDVFGEILSKKLRIYRYLFCLNIKNVKGEQVINPLDIEMVRNQIKYTYKFINDNEKLSSFFIKLLGEYYRAKFPTIYAYIPKKEKTIKISIEGGVKKILWASRICGQKRPEVLNHLAKKLALSNSNYRIDVYGPIENNYSIKFNDFLIYKGEFSSFEKIDLSSYSAFLYTSWFDGIPNVILEAASAGLPIFAPVGRFSAIEEVINEETGWPVIHSDSDDEMADRYLNKIEEFFHDQNEVDKKVRKLMSLLSTQHSFEKHLEGVKKEFLDNDYRKKETESINLNLNGIIYKIYEKINSNKSFSPRNIFDLVDDHDINISAINVREQLIKFEEKDSIKTDPLIKIKKKLSKIPFLYRFTRNIYRIPKVKVYVVKLLSKTK